MLAFILHLVFFDSNRFFKLFFSLFCSLYFGFKFNIIEDFKICPECYGDELCPFFQNHQIQFSWFSSILLIINPKITKSVFYGFFNQTDVLIKRKSRRTAANGIQNVILCPSVKSSEFLFNQISGGIKNKTLWGDLKTSIEPLLLMYFQTQGKWSFPKYHGACGDFLVEEYKGKPLVHFLSSSLEKRVLLAIHLLEMAHSFTFGHSELAFYFTDYSLHNLVVDTSGKIFLVDLDNVIISNKSAVKDNYSFTGNIHTSEILDQHKYAFSPDDICDHLISDHNFFSVCKYLLSHPEDGLLKEISTDFPKRGEISLLLNECSQPTGMKNRFSAGEKLRLLLKEISSNYVWPVKLTRELQNKNLFQTKDQWPTDSEQPVPVIQSF